MHRGGPRQTPFATATRVWRAPAWGTLTYVNLMDHELGLELELIELVEQRERATRQGRVQDIARLDAEIARLQAELADTAERIATTASAS